jgi:hypothetical protein
MQQNFFWKANSSPARHQIPPNFLVITMLTRENDLSLSWARSIQYTPPSYFLKIFLYIISPSMPRSSKLFLSVENLYLPHSNIQWDIFLCPSALFTNTAKANANESFTHGCLRRFGAPQPSESLALTVDKNISAFLHHQKFPIHIISFRLYPGGSKWFIFYCRPESQIVEWDAGSLRHAHNSINQFVSPGNYRERWGYE